MAIFVDSKRNAVEIFFQTKSKVLTYSKSFLFIINTIFKKYLTFENFRKTFHTIILTRARHYV